MMWQRNALPASRKWGYNSNSLSMLFQYVDSNGDGSLNMPDGPAKLTPSSWFSVSYNAHMFTMLDHRGDLMSTVMAVLPLYQL